MFEMQRWTFEITKDSVCDNWLICKKKGRNDNMVSCLDRGIGVAKTSKKTKMQFMIPVAPSN